MSESTTDAGLIEVLLERLEKQRLPRLLALKDKINGGESLDDLDLDFLENSIADARKVIPIIDRHPEYQSLATKVMELYKDISEKALKIEKGSFN
ncbi:MAG: hypothetical protein KAJ32_04380 [Gammaproteobacteria bacterium]|nr:hypothetical protein [Gammaproteobacteria bacterium]